MTRDLENDSEKQQRAEGAEQFGDLVDLAQEIQAEQVADETREKELEAAKDLQQKVAGAQAEEERRQELSKVAREELRRYDEECVAIGRFSYLQLAGQKEQLRKENAPGRFYGGHLSEYVQLGYGTTWKLDHAATQPQDYLEAFDKADRYALDQVNKHPADAENLERFYQSHKDQIVVQRRNALGRPEQYVVQDFSKEVGIKLLNRSILSADNTFEHQEVYRGNIKKSLEGFATAALEDGNVEVALEAYKRLGKLDSPELVARTKQEIEKLRASDKPADKNRLGRIVETIRKASQK